jgi:acetyltransferase-like isoleucine patch superfamily enzyme
MSFFKKIKILIHKYWIRYHRKQLLEKLNDIGCVIPYNTPGFWKVKYEGNNLIPERCQFLSDNISLGYCTTLGTNNIISGNVSIGKYCQLGADVAIHASNHPINYMTTYVNHNLFNGDLKKNIIHSNQIKIGNDVWIGHGVIILGNVTIGNGAILAAGSVVVKDVQPYSIVAGNPAKLIKYRFCESIINEIEKLKWWDMTKDEIIEFKRLFFIDFSNNSSIYSYL